MRAFVESLSIFSGAMLIALVSAGIVGLLSVRTSKILRTIWSVIIPFGLAYSLYWLPVWLGADSSEYSAWAMLIVGTWFMAGFLPSAVIVVIVNRRRTQPS